MTPIDTLSGHLLRRNRTLKRINMKMFNWDFRFSNTKKPHQEDVTLMSHIPYTISGLCGYG